MRRIKRYCYGGKVRPPTRGAVVVNLQKIAKARSKKTVNLVAKVLAKLTPLPVNISQMMRQKLFVPIHCERAMANGETSALSQQTSDVTSLLTHSLSRGHSYSRGWPQCFCPADKLLPCWATLFQLLSCVGLFIYPHQ